MLQYQYSNTNRLDKATLNLAKNLVLFEKTSKHSASCLLEVLTKVTNYITHGV